MAEPLGKQLVQFTLNMTLTGLVYDHKSKVSQYRSDDQDIGYAVLNTYMLIMTCRSCLQT